MKFPKALIPTILFENKNLLVLNKPANLVVHSDGKTAEPNLCDWIISEYPKIANVGEPARAPDGTEIPRPGIVHRLDRETSGVMIVAKTQAAFEYLKQQFQDRLVHKTYNTFVWGQVKESKGTIDKPIGRSASDFRKWSSGRFARGELRDAVTDFKVIAKYAFPSLERAEFSLRDRSSKKTNDGTDGKMGDIGRSPKTKLDSYKMAPLFSFVEVMPQTGRTHQIRVHMHYMNHPVVDDGLYAPHHPDALGFHRLALHARKIEFTDVNGKVLSIEAPLPADFEHAIQLTDKYKV